MLTKNIHHRITTNRNMRKFEYKTIKFDLRGGLFSGGGKVDTENVQNQLNELGNEGWELINTIDTAHFKGASRDLVMILKRELPS